MTTGGLDTWKARIVEAILDNTTAVIYAKDREGRYQLVNRRFEELFGVSAADVCGKTDYDLFTAELADTFCRNDQAVAALNDQLEFEEVAPHDDGPHTYLSLKFPYRDDHGHCLGTCGISTDITRRKTAEAALVQSEKRFRQLAENVPECFWITETATWRVLYVNSAFETIWGRPVEELYREPDAWMNSIHPADRQRVKEAFFANVKTGDYQVEYRIVKPDGAIRWIADCGFPILDEDGEVYRVAGIAEDISQRRELEQQVAEISSRERLRISRDLHDSLGQQLTGLGYLAKSLSNRLASSSEHESSAKEILQGIRHALAEVKRIVRGLAPVDSDVLGLHAALRELVESVGAYSDVDCELVCPESVAIEDNAVATELFRIAQEALNNSVKHANATRITVSLLCDDKAIKLVVADNGSGIGKLANERGMGLRIMRYRSQMICGEFELGSSPQGTKVVCTLNREVMGG